jgi:hypothetical protein
MMKTFAMAVVLAGFASCGVDEPLPLQPIPFAELAPPTSKATPPPGPFNGEVEVTIKSDRPATIFMSTNGSDPRTVSAGRISGASPIKIKITKTTTLKYFASVGGKEEMLHEGTWIRAGAKAGTISGVVVVGQFAIGHKVGLFRNFDLKDLPTPTMPMEIPFSYDGLTQGAHRLTAILDRNDDMQLIPLLDYQSATTTVNIDLTDPFKASVENVRILLGTPSTGKGSLVGTISLPNAPTAQVLQVNILDPAALTGGIMNPMALLTQLQSGYRIPTTSQQSAYDYVLNDLNPGRYTAISSLIGFQNGAAALNLVGEVLRPVTIVADQETVRNFEYGPVQLTGEISVSAASTPMGVSISFLAARSFKLSGDAQVLLLPILLTPNPIGGSRAMYSASAVRSSSTFSLRLFTGPMALQESLQWIFNPFSGMPAQATVSTGVGQDVVVADVNVP